MYSGELEVQAKRKAIAVLQDEINRILNAARSLSTLPGLIIVKDKSEIKNVLDQIANLEEEVETLRRKITRDVADVGGLIMNRENLLTSAYTMDEIAGYITGIAFKLSNLKPATCSKYCACREKQAFGPSRIRSTIAIKSGSTFFQKM